MNTVQSRHQYVNHLAVELLAILGNDTPSAQQCELLEQLISRVSIDHSIVFDNQLTVREASCLYLASLGKNSEETTAILQLKKSTVLSHHKKIKRKLGCSTVTHAVMKGIRFGYVAPFLAQDP